MKLAGKKIGFAFTGSFCTLDKIEKEILHLLEEKAEIYPIFSDSIQTIHSRFQDTDEYRNRIWTLTGHEPVKTIETAEPIGPNHFLDLLIIAPCTGNTLAKLANGITDTPVLMAAKAHLRNEKPLVISLSSNDAMGINFKNIGVLFNSKQIYFVPFGQDDPVKKPNSLIAHTEQIPKTIEMALDGKQIQPVIG